MVSPKTNVYVIIGFYCRKKFMPTLHFRGRAIVLAIFIGGAYLVWGLMFSIQPPFYPKEAEAKGATPSQARNQSLGI